MLLEKDGADPFTDRVRNEEVLHRVKKGRNVLQTVTPCVGTAF